MKMNKTINLVMSAAAAVVLVGVNLGVWLAAGKGMIAPIDNLALWSGFVVLNVVSILWAINMLGLQPLVVSLSYVTGGFLAYRGVNGMDGINVAEVATAGATYGAFGALAVGNATAKVRLAFFNKGQVPFIFVIVGLLAVDAGLNSQVSTSGVSVLLNAVVLPFALAGAVVGLVWSLLNRVGIGMKPSEVIAAAESGAAVAAAPAKASKSDQLVIQMPAHAADAEKPEDTPEKKTVEQPAPAVVPGPLPVVAETAPPAIEKPNPAEPFFPLEIDSDDEYEEKLLESEYAMQAFDESLYASGAVDDEGGVMVAEPVTSVSVALEADPEEPLLQEASATKQDVQSDTEPAQKPKQESAKNDDWLGGHLDLLSKLK
jgi:hypothetical protein